MLRWSACDSMTCDAYFSVASMYGGGQSTRWVEHDVHLHSMLDHVVNARRRPDSAPWQHFRE